MMIIVRIVSLLCIAFLLNCLLSMKGVVGSWQMVIMHLVIIWKRTKMET